MCLSYVHPHTFLLNIKKMFCLIYFTENIYLIWHKLCFSLLYSFLESKWWFKVENDKFTEAWKIAYTISKFKRCPAQDVEVTIYVLEDLKVPYHHTSIFNRMYLKLQKSN